MKTKNFRKRNLELEDGDDDDGNHEERVSLTLEEVKFLQRQRGRKSGIPALSTPVSTAAAGAGASSASIRSVSDKGEGDVEKDDLVLQDTFAQETAVMVEDPNMLRYVEQELAKKRGKNIDTENQVENGVKLAEDELATFMKDRKPLLLDTVSKQVVSIAFRRLLKTLLLEKQVKRRSSGENSTQWTTGIAEIQLPIEYKLRNIEETEAAKKLLQEKKLVGRAKAESSLPSSFSADFFQRGKDYAEKLRKEHPQLYKDKGADDNGGLESRHHDSVGDGHGASRRQAATDEFMLERFRKRERQRLIRR
ncbi:hepatocellular carcinoma-associated antigen 59family protein [Striga asiatica]|uniref:Hepatocellular carcinoma-associated antigen 59family protein n=1 Tax=Striga asiatica TaxID=4170 RepID=A0A5A7QKW8_STRAF|nr:hepatocellular carcinoma-associated antigen 59family protein [Striga asiatica]